MIIQKIVVYDKSKTILAEAIKLATDYGFTVGAKVSRRKGYNKGQVGEIISLDAPTYNYYRKDPEEVPCIKVRYSKYETHESIDDIEHAPKNF